MSSKSVQDQILELIGVQAFHDAGYTGSRVKIMSDEKVYEKDFPNVISPKGWQKSSGSWHGTTVMKYISMIAPDATLIAFPFSGTFGAQEYKSPCADYIKSEGVHVFTSSQLGGNNEGKKRVMQECIDEVGTIFCAAAGNQGEDGLLGESAMDTYLAIGGVKYNKKLTLEKMENTSYSSIGKELDYMAIAEIPTNDELDSGALGTSFCSPVFAGQVGLVQDFFIDKTGKPITYPNMIKFINDNTIDLKDKGFDIYTGHGLFVLPKPHTIEISKYCPEYTVATKSIELYVGKKTIYVDGDKEIPMDVAPYIKNSRTYVPLRFISEALGKEVEWDPVLRKITIK